MAGGIPLAVPRWPEKTQGHFEKKSLTAGASRLMKAQMDLPRLLSGVDFQIFYSDASNI